MHVLIIGEPSRPEGAVQAALTEAGVETVLVQSPPGRGEGLTSLAGADVSAVVVDLPEDDPRRAEAIEALERTAPHMPVLVVGTVSDRGRRTGGTAAHPHEFIERHRIDSVTLPLAIEHVVARKAAEEQAFFDQQRAHVTLNAIGDAVVSTDGDGRITFMNPAAEKMTGWTSREAADRPVAEIFRVIDSTTRQPPADPLFLAMRTNSIAHLSANCLLVGRDGTEVAIEDTASPIQDRAGRVIGAVLVFKDVSAARALSRQVAHLAQHDFLTDLPNRMVLYDRLTQAISLSRRYGHSLAVLFLDLDRFKQVNDTCGHVVGDALLQSVARKLVGSVRGSDTVCRLGGDEFVILLSEIEAPGDAAIIAQKTLTNLNTPFEVSGYSLQVTGTIGISVFPDDGSDAEALVKAADMAMYYARNEGERSYQFFEPQMNARAMERQWLESNLQGALARNEFVLHYQPKYDLQTGQLTGAEALLRWAHPERGLLLPRGFMPIAEECGLIVPIGRWVLRQVCAQARAWLDHGRPSLRISVNVSAAEFQHDGFLEGVTEALAENRLGGEHLAIELTESALLRDIDATIVRLRALERLGVQIAVDDFGTGYSSLTYLRQFPLSVLKIDRSFIQEITGAEDGASLIRAVIGMGRMLGHRVSAEGIETREQLGFLQAEICAEGQGYYFSPPLQADRFAALPPDGLPELVFH